MKIKDTLITVRRKKTELLTWLICFATANLLNVYAIIVYKTSMWEILTSFFYVFTFSCVLYALWTAVRLLAFGIKRFLRNTLKNRTHNS